MLNQVFNLPALSGEDTETETTGTFHSRKPNSGQVEQTLSTSDGTLAQFSNGKKGGILAQTSH